MTIGEEVRSPAASPALPGSKGITALVGVTLGVALYVGGGIFAGFAPGIVSNMVGAVVLSILWLLCLKMRPDALLLAGIVALLLMAFFAIIGPGAPGRQWSPTGLFPAALLLGPTSVPTMVLSLLSIGVPLVLRTTRAR